MTTTIINKTVSTTRIDTNILADVSFTSGSQVRVGFDQSSTKVAGFAKTANSFYRILFTEKGSDPHNKNRGTELVKLFTSSIYDEDVLFASVQHDVVDATNQIIEAQTVSNADENEKLVNTRIVSFSFDRANSSITFGIELYNLAGSKAVIEIPSVVIS